MNVRRLLYKAVRQPSYAFYVLRRRAGAYLQYWIGSGRSACPESVTLFLTHRCNLQCRMCGQWGMSGVTKKRDKNLIAADLSLEELKKIVDDLASFRPNITLFGGEPLLYKSVTELIRYIKAKRMHCLMITNGSLLGELADGIVKSGLDELNVSLDGDAGIHDAIRGLPGLFDRITAGLARIREMKAALNSKTPLVNIQCAITKDNYGKLERLLDVAAGVGADSLTFHNLIFVRQNELDAQKEYDRVLGCRSDEWEGFKFDPEIDPEILYEKISKILAGRYPFTVDLYPNLPRDLLIRYYRDPGFRPGACRCLSPWIAAYIFPDGEVRPCLNLDYSYGNALEGGFTGLWNGEKAVRFRRFLKRDRAFPACARCTELYRY